MGKMVFIANVLKETDSKAPSGWETVMQTLGFLVALVIVLLSASYTPPAPTKPRANSVLVSVEIESETEPFESERETEDSFSGFSLTRQDTPMVHDLTGRCSMESVATDSTTPTWSLISIPEEKEIVHDYDHGLRMYYPLEYLMAY